MQHMVRLIDDLLDVSRITADKLELRQEPVDARRQSSSRPSRPARPLIDHGGLAHADLDAAGPAGHPHRRRHAADAGRSRTCCSNACKYTARGGRIEVAAAASRTIDVVLSVRDNGIGIPRGFAAQPLRDVLAGRPPLERSEGGLGHRPVAGPAARRAARRHGRRPQRGRRHAAASSSSGCRWRRTARPRAPTRIRAAGTARPRAACWWSTTTGHADSAGGAAHADGPRARPPTTARRRSCGAERFRPEVILLDIGMPKLNGYEACRRIRQQPWGAGMRIDRAHRLGPGARIGADARRPVSTVTSSSRSIPTRSSGCSARCNAAGTILGYAFGHVPQHTLPRQARTLVERHHRRRPRRGSRRDAGVHIPGERPALVDPRSE